AAALRDAYALRASRVLHGSLTIAGGRLRLWCVVEDLDRRRTLTTMAPAGPVQDGVLPLLSQVARALSETARPFPSNSEAAVRLLSEAANAEDYRRAAAADPDFGQGYVAWARWLAGRGEPREASRVLGVAQARGERIAPIERAEIAAMAASIAGDRDARVRALGELAALTPSDADLARALGQLEFAAWRLEPALNWYRRAIRLEPATADLWNMQAYAQAQRSEFDAARRSLAEYARLAPDDPNAPDSLGEVNFMAGDFAEAEKSFLAAYRMNATWRGGSALLKAAHARAMTGDLAGADGLLAQYLELRKTLQDPLIPYRQAQWEFLTGRRRQAMERLESFRAARVGDVAAHTTAQLAVWKRQTGDRDGARRLALDAAKLASGPAAQRLAGVLLFVTQPPAAANEWAVRAERAFAQPADAPRKQYALAYALLFEGHFREASVLLKHMRRQTSPTSAGDLSALAAWALLETGQAAEARPLAALYPIPEAQGEPAFGSLTVPRVLLVRSRLADQAEAARLLAIYEKLKGDLPDAR
ncbi:MAG: hypothetical protein AAB654_23750, partial [Acidobacteriota bacterium]